MAATPSVYGGYSLGDPATWNMIAENAPGKANEFRRRLRDAPPDESPVGWYGMFVDDPRSTKMPPARAVRKQEVVGTHVHYEHMARDCTRWFSRHFEVHKRHGVHEGLHPNVADTLWKNHIDGDNPEVYQTLADNIRRAIGTTHHTTWTGNPYLGHPVEGTGKLSGTCFSIGVMVGLEKGERAKDGEALGQGLFFKDCTDSQIAPPFRLYEQPELELNQIEPGEADAINLYFQLDPSEERHRMCIFVLKQYSMEQLDAIYDCVVNVDLFKIASKDSVGRE